MASKDREQNSHGTDSYSVGTRSDAKTRQPARVVLTGQGGSQMNVAIGKITGIVTIGKKNVVTHYNYPSAGSQRKGHPDFSDSNSESESSSLDSECEDFAMPMKNRFKEMKRKFKEMKTRFKSSPASTVPSLVVKQNGATSAFDKSGRPIPIPSQNLPSRPKVEQVAPINQQRNSNSQPLMNQQPAASSDLPTVYEQQTQKFETIMTHLQNKTMDETDRVIYRIPAEFGTGWRRVFRHLNFSDAEIDDTFVECGEVKETVQKLLIKWKQSAVTPDVKTLVEALVRADQVHIVRFFHS